MKSALHRISDTEYLRQAWKAIAKDNPRSKGLDGVTIAAFKGNLEENLRQISAELRANNYVFHKLRAHAMKKTGSTAKRPLQIAAVRDRVVMKAVATLIAPAFERFNLPCSFAYIRDRGVEPAIKRIYELVAQGHKTYLEADIINFFGSVDRELLWERFSKNIRYKSLLPLIRACFDQELGNIEELKTEDQNLFAHSDTGIPQGGVLSPMLANFYLYEFDRKLLKNGFNLVRYADDFVVMCDSDEKARKAHDLCKRTLEGLHLEIHPLGSDKTRIANFSKEGLNFLGLHFQGKDVFPARKVRERFELKIKEVLKPDSGLSLLKTLQKISNLVQGWGKYYRTMQVREIYIALDRFIETSVEAYLQRADILLRGRNKRKPLKRLGIPSLAAMIDDQNAATKRPILPKANVAAAAAGSGGQIFRTEPTGMTIKEDSGSLRLVPIKKACAPVPCE